MRPQKDKKQKVARQKTALYRTELSRPLRLAVEDGIINSKVHVFDYGCGRGSDLKRLRQMRINCDGWDPFFMADATCESADVVNLGYVVNVIEDPDERKDTLKRAWNLAKGHLIVSARLKADAKGLVADDYEDGVVTRAGTFQKFYDQSELRNWIDETLAVRSLPAAPGIFYVFRNEDQRQAFEASQYRRRSSTPRLRKSDVLFNEHKPLFKTLMTFLTDRGRLPAPDELPHAQKLIEVAGSIKKAYRVILRVTEIKDWEQIREDRAHDLLVHIALSRFGGRPRFNKLECGLQRDVKEFFGTYKRACEQADELLFSAGNLELVSKSCRESPVGKMTPGAFYVHISALGELPPILRVYEGCARAYIGAVDHANIIKLSREDPRVSYLHYPDFELNPHPVLASSVIVPLRSFHVRFIDYRDRENRPILHRKEEFVSSNHPDYGRFQRQTQFEVAEGLLVDGSTIGTQKGWEKVQWDEGIVVV